MRSICVGRMSVAQLRETQGSMLPDVLEDLEKVKGQFQLGLTTKAATAGNALQDQIGSQAEPISKHGISI